MISIETLSFPSTWIYQHVNKWNTIRSVANEFCGCKIFMLNIMRFISKSSIVSGKDIQRMMSAVSLSKEIE
jgi:hypothetical protein